MKPIEYVNELLDFPTHIKKIQNAIKVCEECNNKNDASYYKEALKEILKIRQNIEVKIAKERSASNGA